MADNLDARLGRLEDRLAIDHLIASYGPLADSGNAKALSELWTEDGVYCVGGYSEARGREQIAALITSPTHEQLMQNGCAHVLSAPVIRLDGDRATATNYSIVFRHRGDSFEPWRVSANRWALVKADGAWRVARRDNSPLDGDAAARALLKL